MGIGFAIPVNMVKSVVAAAKAAATVKRPWLGATLQSFERYRRHLGSTARGRAGRDVAPVVRRKRRV